MVDANGMAKCDSIQDLEKGVLRQDIVANKTIALSDVGEQITIRAVLDHHERAVRTIQDLNQLDNIGMLACVVVQLNFSSLELALTMVQSNLGQGFDSIGPAGRDVDG